jgi:hypothetical protein
MFLLYLAFRLPAARVTIADMRDSEGELVRDWYRGSVIDPVTAFLARTGAWGGVGAIAAGAVLRAIGHLFPSRDGIGVGDNGVLVRSRSRPDQWVPWSEVERFEVVSRGRGDAISVIRGNGEPLLAGRFRTNSFTRARNARAIEAYKVQQALEHERVKAIRAARRSAPG